MPTVLSTKKLSLAQKSLLLNSGIGYVEYDAIKVDPLDLPSTTPLQDNLIFTSKNAVKWVLRSIEPSELHTKKIFCVGEKTGTLLTSSGLTVLESEIYGSALGEKIISHYKDCSFTYFCGNIRRDELPEILNRNNIPLEEIIVYSSSLNIRKFGQEFDGVLFYSPSGVKSYCSKNTLQGCTAFCIGETTAAEAKKYTDLIVVANKPSIENLIVQVVKIFK